MSALTSLFTAVVWTLIAISSLPLLLVALEATAAMLLRRHLAGPGCPVGQLAAGPWPKTVILIPAHNEASVIRQSLVSFAADLPPNARMVCIAHNCSDETAAIARNFGADVLEVIDDGTGGKPAALVAGFRALDDDPPDVVVIVDADCEVMPGSLKALAQRAYELGHPVMGTYLFSPAEGDSGKASMSSLAILLKNHIRPLGLKALGLPCLLNGSGSAYPFSAIRGAPHGQGSIAEDFQLSIDLLRMGYPTTYVPEAVVLGKLPVRQDTAMRQRRRWEHGHLSLVFRTAPQLFLEGLREFDLKRVALALEVGVLPLGLLSLACCAVLAFTGLHTMLTGNALPMFVAMGADLVFALAVGMAIIRFGGWAKTAEALQALPAYVFWKAPLYLDFFRNPESIWRKTDRD